MIQQNFRPGLQWLLPLPLLRAAVALALGFHVAYIPFHVLTERHLDDAGSVLDFEHSDETPDGDHDHHTPHPVTAHAIHAVVRTYLAVDHVFIQTDALGLPAPRELASLPCEPQRLELSGESPPDRIRPRAPPAA